MVADDACKFKQLHVVRESVKHMASLTPEEKTALDDVKSQFYRRMTDWSIVVRLAQLIQREDVTLLDLVNKSTSADQLGQSLTT